MDQSYTSLLTRPSPHQALPVKLVSGKLQLIKTHIWPPKVALVRLAQLLDTTSRPSGVPWNTRTHGLWVYVEYYLFRSCHIVF
jgi:hypothetical protein